MNKNLSNLLLIIFALVLGGLACKGYTEGKPAAEKAITQFHSMLDQERYDEIYDASDPAMKDAATREKMLKIFTAVHTKLGKVTGSTQTRWQVGNFNLKSAVMIEAETTFEKGKATESFTFFIDGQTATLAGYFVNSDDLITN